MIATPTLQTRLQRRRWWVRLILIGLFASPVLFFLLSNAWLQSGWGRGWVERQIFQRTQVPVRIGGAGWLPGGQVWIDDLRVVPSPSALPHDEPLLHIRCLSIRPAWSAWWRGSRKISDVCLSAPRLHVPLERWKEWMPAPQAPPATSPPAVAAASPPAAPSAPNSPVAAPEPSAAPPAPAPSEEVPSPTVWLKITEGSLTVSHPSQSLPLLQIENISTEMPIGGAPASGHLQCSAIRSMEETVSTLGRIAIRWQYPLWETDGTVFSAADLKAQAKVQIARLPGLPFAAVISQEKQAWLHEKTSLQAQEIQSLHRINGFLLGLQTWQGESLCEAQHLSLPVGGKDLRFFRAQSRFVLRGGMLQCADLRLLGDDFGLMGNGLCTLRGDWLCQLRLLAPRVTAQDWRQRWAIVSPQQPLPFQTQISEDRPSLDFLCGGNFAQPGISLDQGKTWLDPRNIRTLLQQPLTPPAP